MLAMSSHEQVWWGWQRRSAGLAARRSAGMSGRGSTWSRRGRGPVRPTGAHPTVSVCLHGSGRLDRLTDVCPPDMKLDTVVRVARTCCCIESSFEAARQEVRSDA